MQFLFIAVGISGLIYFIYQNRRFDYFALAFLSSLIYFMPGFFGSSAYYVDGKWIEIPIHPEAYAVMIAVMLSILIFSFFPTRIPNGPGPRWSFPVFKWAPGFLIVIALIGLFGMLAYGGSEIFQPEKKLAMEHLGRWHILFYTAATLGLPISYIFRKYVSCFLFIIFLGFDLFIGFRVALAISLMSVLVLILLEQGKQRLINTNWKILVAILFFGLLMFGYKIIYYYVKAGMWDVVLEILSTPDTYIKIISQSEPFVTQQILNQVISQDFRTSMNHIYDCIYQFTLFAPEQGVHVTTFNSLFQPVLFPEVPYGMAANIWAQMWSAGGWTLLIFFILFYNMILMLGNWTLRFKNPIIKAGLTPIFCYWAFYIHRNELGYVLDLEKRLILLLLMLLFLMTLIKDAIGPRAAREN